MTITEGTQPAVVTWTDSWSAGKTTASFTPESGALLVALVSADGTGAEVTTASITDSAGSGWSMVRRENTQNGSLGGTVEVWIRNSPGTSMTVTCTPASGGTANGGQLAVRTLVGAEVVANQNGATGAAAFATAAAVQISVAAGTGNRVYGAAINWDNSTVMSLLANTSAVNQFSDTTNGDTWETFKSTGDTAGTATYGFSTSHVGHIVAVEIKAAASGTNATVVPPARVDVLIH